jgi:hypothetical protein
MMAWEIIKPESQYKLMMKRKDDKPSRPSSMPKLVSSPKSGFGWGSHTPKFKEGARLVHKEVDSGTIFYGIKDEDVLVQDTHINDVFTQSFLNKK